MVQVVISTSSIMQPFHDGLKLLIFEIYQTSQKLILSITEAEDVSSQFLSVELDNVFIL